MQGPSWEARRGSEGRRGGARSRRHPHPHPPPHTWDSLSLSADPWRWPLRRGVPLMYYYGAAVCSRPLFLMRTGLSASRLAEASRRFHAEGAEGRGLHLMSGRAPLWMAMRVWRAPPPRAHKRGPMRVGGCHRQLCACGMDWSPSGGAMGCRAREPPGPARLQVHASGRASTRRPGEADDPVC